MKNLTKYGLTALAAVPAAFLQADPAYNWEVGVDYVTGDTDINNVDVNEDNIGLDATYYFDVVDPGMGSLREAPFVERISYVGLAFDIRDLDDDFDNAVDLDTWRADAKLIDRETGWYGRFGFVDANADFGDADMDADIGDVTPEYNGYAVAVGKYILENTTAQLGYTEIDYKGDFALSEAESDTIGVGVKHFGPITEAIAYSIEANYYFLDLQVADFDDLDDDPFDDSGDAWSLTGTVYPLRELGVGISYTDSDALGGRPYLTSTSEIDDGFALFADWFVTENIALKAVYNNREFDLADNDELQGVDEVERDTILFGADFRF